MIVITLPAQIVVFGTALDVQAVVTRRVQTIMDHVQQIHTHVTQNQNVQELDTLGVTMPATQTQVTALEQASYNTMGKHLYQNRDLSHRY